MALFLSLFLFFATITLLFPEESLSVKISTASLAFLGFLGLVPFICREYFGASYYASPLEILLFSLVLFLPTLIFKRRSFSWLKIKPLSISSPIRLGVAVLIAIFLGTIIVKGYFTSVRGWDAYALYDSRAKLFLDGVSLKDVGVFSVYDYYNQYYYLSYPPMTSVIHAVFYASGFASPMITYSLFYTSVFLLTYDYLKKTKIALFYKVVFFTAVAFNKQIFGHMGLAYTNLPMTAFLLGGVVFLLRYLEMNKMKHLVLSGFLIAFSRWTRYTEPVYWLFIITLVYFLARKKEPLKYKILSLLLYALPIFSITALWHPYRDIVIQFADHSGENKAIISSLLEVGPGRVFEVTTFVFKALSSLGYYFVVSLFILIFAFYKKSPFGIKSKALLVFLVLFLGMMVAGTLVFSVTRPFWQVLSGSLLRSSIFLVPLTMLFSASLLERIIFKNLAEKKGVTR